MKSFRDDLIDRMKTGWGRFVLASKFRLLGFQLRFRNIAAKYYIKGIGTSDIPKIWGMQSKIKRKIRLDLST
jgi:hypothetical protein